LLQLLHGFGHVLQGFGHVPHFGHRLGACMLVITLAVDCIMLHGCPHVGHAFGCAHLLHVEDPHPEPANAGTANITATATTNTNAANFFIATPLC
jgi:hypothetical protein